MQIVDACLVAQMKCPRHSADTSIVQEVHKNRLISKKTLLSTEKDFKNEMSDC